MATPHRTKMAVNPNNFNHRGGGNYGIIVRLPQIVADDRLVYFDYDKKRGSWVIRDFVTGQKFDSDHSTLTVSQIEADATYDEFSIWCNVEKVQSDWTTYLKLRSTAVFRLSASLNSPKAENPRSGTWHSL